MGWKMLRATSPTSRNLIIKNKREFIMQKQELSNTKILISLIALIGLIITTQLASATYTLEPQAAVAEKIETSNY